jgi:hypothetical protein
MVRTWWIPGKTDAPAEGAQLGAVSPRVALGRGVELMSGFGDPNGVRRARRGSWYAQRDAMPIPVVWINIDGAFAWVALASVNDICDDCGCMMARNGDTDDFVPLPDTVLKYEISASGLISSIARSGGWWLFESNLISGVLQAIQDQAAPWSFGPNAAGQINLDFHWRGHLGSLADTDNSVQIGLGLDRVPPAAGLAAFQSVLQNGTQRWIAIVEDGFGNVDVYQDVNITVGQTCPTTQVLRIQGTTTGILFTVDGVQLGFAPWTDAQTAFLLNKLLRRLLVIVWNEGDSPQVFSDKWCAEQDHACVEGPPA